MSFSVSREEIFSVTPMVESIDCGVMKCGLYCKKNTSTIYAIKKYVDNKEVYLTIRANSHENIIQFRGVTKLKGEKKYSLVLEHADGNHTRGSSL
ncbi:unnamed protein product [Rhizophagus irregularis]|nr:unnamed protein product [Rhizophagus irregularis]